MQQDLSHPIKLNNELYIQEYLAHQLSRNDEHPYRTTYQYHRCHFPGACGRNRIGRIRPCRDLVSGCLYARLRFQFGFTGRYRTVQRRTALFRDGKNILSRIVFPVGACCPFVPVLQTVFPDDSKSADCFCGGLSCRD